jgi:murein DD-endopeptidase MepM/ murein hydrolase activator NlpD
MAISSPILNTKSSATRPKGTSTSMGTIKNIQQILLKKGKVKKEILDKKTKITSQRKEKEKRKRTEDELEATNLVIKPSGPIRMIQSSTKGFLERLLGFLSYLTVGWLMNNLPTWIAMGKEFIGRMQRMGQLIGGFVTNVKNIFTGFGKLLGATFQNLIQFDLFDSSNRVKDAFGQLTGSVDDMGKELEEAIRLITTPLTDGIITGEDAPSTGEQRTSEGAYEPGGPMQAGGAAPGAYDIASRLGATKEQWDIYRNTLAQIESGGRYDEPGGSGKHYDGRYQMGELAKKDAARILGIPYPGHSDDPNHPSRVAFRKNPELQERMLAAYTLANDGYLSRNSKYQSKQTVEQKLQVLGYAHNQGATGTSRWLNTGIVGRDGFNTKGTAYSDALARNFRSRVNPYPTQQIPSTSQPQITPGRGVTTTVRDEINVSGPSGGTPSVGLSREKGAQYLAKRGGGRKHAGMDIGTSGQRGYYVSFKQSGKVTYAKNNGRGYGNLVIIKSGNIEFYFAHLATILVKEGQQYNGETIGEIGKTGGDYPIHLHFEARPNGNPINPKPYLNLLSIGKQLTGISGKPMGIPTPAELPAAQITSTQAQQRQQLSQQLAQERRGQTVIIQQPSEPESQPVQYVSGGSQSETLEIDEFTLVNNFIKNKLLLDLAYL